MFKYKNPTVLIILIILLTVLSISVLIINGSREEMQSIPQNISADTSSDVVKSAEVGTLVSQDMPMQQNNDMGCDVRHISTTTSGNIALEVCLKKEVYEEGEPIIATVMLINQSTNKVCIAGLPQSENSASGEERINFELSLVGSLGRISPVSDFATNNEVTVVTLLPNEVRKVTADITALYGFLGSDTYSVIADYRPDRVDVSGDDLVERGCVRAGRALNIEEIKILARDEASVVKKYSSIWKEDRASPRSQEAFSWLIKNALKKGMTKNEVLNLLGDPTKQTNTNRWEYPNIHITFDGEKVTDFNFFIE